jgi:hypothetical protein
VVALRGCGGSTRLQHSSSAGSIPGIPYSLLRGGRNHGFVSKIKSQDVRSPFLSKNKEKIKESLAIAANYHKFMSANSGFLRQDKKRFLIFYIVLYGFVQSEILILYSIHIQ